MTGHDRNHLSSLKRGLKALALLNGRGSMTVTELAKLIGVPRTTAHRILETLAVEGYTDKLPYSFTYHIAPAANALSSNFSDESWIIHVASPLLIRATKDLNWSFSVATRSDENMVVRLSTDRGAANAITYFVPGVTNTVLETVCGHVMAGHATPEDRALIAQRLAAPGRSQSRVATLDPLTGETTMEPLPAFENPTRTRNHILGLLGEIADRIQSEGYAHIRGRNVIEAAVAAPILLNGVAKAALVMRYIKSAIPPERIAEHFVPLLADISEEISRGVREEKAPLQAIR